VNKNGGKRPNLGYSLNKFIYALLDYLLILTSVRCSSGTKKNGPVGHLKLRPALPLVLISYLNVKFYSSLPKIIIINC